MWTQDSPMLAKQRRLGTYASAIPHALALPALCPLRTRQHAPGCRRGCLCSPWRAQGFGAPARPLLLQHLASINPQEAGQFQHQATDCHMMEKPVKLCRTRRQETAAGAGRSSRLISSKAEEGGLRLEA